MEMEYALEEIDSAAKILKDLSNTYKVFTFTGNLGAGKTTLIQQFCRQMGVSQHVSSPTFSVINQYDTPSGGTIYHMDLYRIKDEEEAIQAGVEDCLKGNDYCFIEWPDKAPGLLPDSYISVELYANSPSSRKMAITIH
jgi:tRNA threonylcarbamoyladenosine biosynthesis protein TsaE